jgi:hypothetical protein
MISTVVIQFPPSHDEPTRALPPSFMLKVWVRDLAVDKWKRASNGVSACREYCTVASRAV